MPPQLPNGVTVRSSEAAKIRVIHPYYKVVKGVPAAIVRSYKEPLYDSVQILAAAPATERIWFQRPLGQTLEDGVTTKTLLHTNLNQSGTLGTPLSFDIYGFNLRLPKNITKANYNLIEAAGVVVVQFGQDTQFLTVPMEEIPSGVDTEGLGATDSPHVGWGTVDNFYRFDIGGQALHINSTESFSVKLQFPSGLAGVTGNQLAKFYQRGIKYKGRKTAFFLLSFSRGQKKTQDALCLSN